MTNTCSSLQSMAGEHLRAAVRHAVEDAFLPYLHQVLAQRPAERHAHIQTQFAAHMDLLADFCLSGYPGAGGLTVDFIKGLHRAMFPPNYREEKATPSGDKVWLIPGEFRAVCNITCVSYLHPGQATEFLPAVLVPGAMEERVARINAELAGAADKQQALDAILWFALDFGTIHPFVDWNGRVACILADLLALTAGLPAFHFMSIKVRDLPNLYRVVEQACETHDLAPVHAMLAARHDAGVKP